MFRLFNSIFKKKEVPTSETDNTVKYLIAGLGNIGPDYVGTRHNIGFDVCDYLAGKFNVSYKSDKHAYVGSFKHKGRTFILIKPTTYMNLSGQAIRYWMQKEKIKKDNLMVVLDDLNIDFGAIRIKAKGGAGGHNGLKNIEQILNTAQYPRLRVGIGNKFSKGRQVDFVLGRWAEDEEPLLDKVIEHAAAAILGFGTIGLERTMNQYNKNLSQAPKKKKVKKKPLTPTDDSEKKTDQDQ